MEQDSSIGAVDDSTANTFTAKIREYGNIVMTTPRRMEGADPITAAVTNAIERQINELKEILDICGDAEIVSNFEILESPRIDVLDRFRSYGWYGKFASANYEKLEAHFSCRKRHIPEKVTMEFITQMIDEYARSEALRNQFDDEDYDEDE